MRLSKKIQIVAAFVLIGTAIAIESAMPAMARPIQSLSARPSRRRLSFRVGARPSRYRVGGFSRSAACGTQNMIALVPPKQNQEKIPDKQEAVDQTASDRPAFFVYVPALPPTTGQFTLQNEAGTEELYNLKFNLTGKPGIVGIVLPSSGPALEVGQKYVWQVKVKCEGAEDLVVSNWIERVATPTTGAKDDRLITLAQKGIWQDVITVIALQRYQQPSDPAITADWVALMEDGGMQEFKQAAIIQLVTK